MAYRSTVIEVRPDTSVDFFTNTDDHKAYIVETYEDTNKSSFTISYSNNSLTKTKVRNYDNKDTFEEMKDDEKCNVSRELRDAYNTENEISMETFGAEV